MRIPADVWTRLAAQGLTGDALTSRCALPQVSERVLAAVDRQGRRHLLVALFDGESELSDRKSRGVEIATRELLVMDGEPRRYLDWLCSDPMGFDVFDSLGGELAAALAAGVEEPAIAAKRLLGKWRRFWLVPPGSALSREQQVGLFAELWFLAYWLIPKVGAVRAIEAWRGPLGARHDIEMVSLSIEIKATTSAAGRTHRIHGIDQLGLPEEGRLMLFSLATKEEGGGTNTLPSIVERVRAIASDDDEAIVRFETRLARAGYASSAAADYEGLRLRVVDERLYRVEGAFPRLLRESLNGGVPSGVGDIEYGIDLSGFDSLIAATRPEQFSLT